MRKNIDHSMAGILAACLTVFVIGGRAWGQASELTTVTSSVSRTAADHGWAVNYPKQRKLFVMADLLWVFYSDGANAVYRSSADGRTWSDPTTFGTGGHYGHRFGCWFDGNFIHYTLCTSALGADVYYRRGRPNGDGTIAWAASQQVAYDTPSDKNVMYPKIIVDSAGRPWIAFMQLVYQVPNAPPFDAIVVKSSTNDGSWATASRFPFFLVNQKPVAGYPDPVGAPLTGGKTFWFYNNRVQGTDVYAARLWNGRTWGKEEVVVKPASIYSFFDVVADGNDVHVVHGAGTIRYQKRTWGKGWGKATIVNGSASGHTSLSRIGTNNMIVTWLDMSTEQVRYREVVRGKWRSPVSWVDESTDGLAGSGININTMIESGGRFRHAAIYSTGESSPFRIEFVGVMGEAD